MGPRNVRDISWLSFNERVLQEAQDASVPLSSRLRFLGIFSNNLDEFFRVRVATLTRMLKLGKEALVAFEKRPEQILKEIQVIVRSQQKDFEATYEIILAEMKRKKIVMLNDKQLSKEQTKFVESYFDEKVRTNISPLMIESIPELPLLHDKSIYLACTLSNEHNSFMNSYTLIEVPTQVLPRFVILPSNKGVKSIILLEDIIRVCLPKLFTQFGFTTFEGYIFKVTRDAELDIDNDIQSTLIQQLQKSLKARKKGKAVRFVYDKSMPKNLLDYLVKLLSLSRRDQLVPGGRIHNFKDFINFPNEVFEEHAFRPAPFIHPLFVQPIRILDVLKQRDVMLHFPYHSFDSVIDLLREAAIDPFVESIKITCYRLAKESKIINALINAVRNGKKVVVVIELRARFDEEANLRWKQILEEEGVEVYTGFPEMKVHAKVCLISKRINRSLQYFGFVSTGNLNESTAKIYGDHCLLTADKRITTDIRHVFAYLMKQKNVSSLRLCKHLLVSPLNTRSYFMSMLQNATRSSKKSSNMELVLKLNSLSDPDLIYQLYHCAAAGMPVHLIIRGICCAHTEMPKWPKPMHAISIVDEFLEHARIIWLRSKREQTIFISSADWMQRNLDYRVEVSAPVFAKEIQDELQAILQIQLAETKKARILDNQQTNAYAGKGNKDQSLRSQEEIFKFLIRKKY